MAKPKRKVTADPPIDLLKVERQLCRRSLVDYMREAWTVLEPANVYQHNWHIDAMSEHLMAVYPQRQIRQLVINIPPRHMKSLGVSVFWPTWLWIDMPWLRFLFTSYGEDLALRDSDKCRRLIESRWYQDHFGESFQIRGDANQKGRFENDKSGYRLATSVGGKATGEGGDILVCDDPHKLDEAHSDVKREGVLSWWSEVTPTRLNNPKTGARVIIMQRVHENDLTGHVLKEGGWEHLMLPAEYNPSRVVPTSLGFTDPRKTPGELLWPQRVGQREIEALKRSLGPYAAAAQLQQSPAPEEGGILKKDWWRFYRQSALPTHWEYILMSVDCAFKDVKDSSYVVITIWGKSGVNRYLLDLARDRWDFTMTLAMVRQMKQKWPQSKPILIEDKANGPAVISVLQHEMVGVLPFEVNKYGSKEARAFAVQPEVAAGQVYLPMADEAPWVTEYISELAAFPRGEYDDQVDSTTQALLYIGERERVRSEAGPVMTLERQPAKKEHRPLLMRERSGYFKGDGTWVGPDPRGEEPK